MSLFSGWSTEKIDQLLQKLEEVDFEPGEVLMEITHYRFETALFLWRRLQMTKCCFHEDVKTKTSRAHVTPSTLWLFLVVNVNLDHVNHERVVRQKRCEL